jgi:hypothetical protein
MIEKYITKKGYYKVYEITRGKKIMYRVDSGKTILMKKFNKRIPNPYRDMKEFNTLELALSYIGSKIVKNNERKKKIIKKLPKSLYLVLIKEEKSKKTFVKVGITSKKYILRRFSKLYGYEGYTVESILRRIDSPNAEKMEGIIKEKLNKKKTVNKYRPLLESFSGYSECYNYNGYSDIIKIFDDVVKKYG